MKSIRNVQKKWKGKAKIPIESKHYFLVKEIAPAEEDVKRLPPPSRGGRYQVHNIRQSTQQVQGIYHGQNHRCYECHQVGQIVKNCPFTQKYRQ